MPWSARIRSTSGLCRSGMSVNSRFCWGVKRTPAPTVWTTRRSALRSLRSSPSRMRPFSTNTPRNGRIRDGEDRRLRSALRSLRSSPSRMRPFLGVFVENGRIRDGEDRRLRSALRRVVETVGGGVRFTPQQNLLLTDIPDRQRPLVDRILADHGVAGHRSLSVVRRWSMACPALPTCGLAVAEAERALPDVIAELEAELERLGVADAALTVRMTGCPNGCARPY